jgi:hypothetical protein
VHKRGEVGISRANGERRDEPALVRELDRIDGHLDVSCILPQPTDALGNLDELDVRPGEQPAVGVEVRPIGVGSAHHHTPPLG